jgi:hypothetical protein
MYVGTSGDKLIYISVTKGRSVHLKNHSISGSYDKKTLLGLSVVVFLLVDHYTCYTSLELTLIKEYKYYFSLQGFSRGFYLKIFLSCVQYFWFPCL